MDKNKVRKQFGCLPPKYNFSLNPYSEMRFSKCPDCQNKTGQRKLPLLIHVEPKNLIALNYTNRILRLLAILIKFLAQLRKKLGARISISQNH